MERKKKPKQAIQGKRKWRLLDNLNTVRLFVCFVVWASCCVFGIVVGFFWFCFIFIKFYPLIVVLLVCIKMSTFWEVYDSVMLYSVVNIYSWQLPEGFGVFLGIQYLLGIWYHFIPDFISKDEVIVKERWLVSKV